MPAASAPPGFVHADPQDALPESDWGPRRRYYFGRAIACLALIALAIVFKAQSSISIALTVVLILDSVVYGIAPSGEQAVKMFQIVSLLKSGVSMFQSSSASTDGTTASAETSTVTGAPADVQAAAGAN